MDKRQRSPENSALVAVKRQKGDDSAGALVVSSQKGPQVRIKPVAMRSAWETGSGNIQSLDSFPRFLSLFHPFILDPDDAHTVVPAVGMIIKPIAIYFDPQTRPTFPPILPHSPQTSRLPPRARSAPLACTPPSCSSRATAARSFR